MESPGVKSAYAAIVTDGDDAEDLLDIHVIVQPTAILRQTARWVILSRWSPKPAVITTWNLVHNAHAALWWWLVEGYDDGSVTETAQLTEQVKIDAR